MVALELNSFVLTNETDRCIIWYSKSKDWYLCEIKDEDFVPILDVLHDTKKPEDIGCVKLEDKRFTIKLYTKPEMSLMENALKVTNWNTLLGVASSSLASAQEVLLEPGEFMVRVVRMREVIQLYRNDTLYAQIDRSRLEEENIFWTFSALDETVGGNDLDLEVFQYYVYYITATFHWTPGREMYALEETNRFKTFKKRYGMRPFGQTEVPTSTVSGSREDILNQVSDFRKDRELTTIELKTEQNVDEIIKSAVHRAVIRKIVEPKLRPPGEGEGGKGGKEFEDTKAHYEEAESVMSEGNKKWTKT